MPLLTGITFAKAVTLVQILTRDNGAVTQYATPTLLLDAFIQAVKDINQQTRSVVIDNLESPIIYQGAPVVTVLATAANSGASSILVAQNLNLLAGMTLTINDPTPSNSETLTVANTYVPGSTTVPFTTTLAHSHVQGCGVTSNNRLYDFPNGFNAVYRMDFNGMALDHVQLDTLYDIYSIWGQHWDIIRGIPKYWYTSTNQAGSQTKFGIFPVYPSGTGWPIHLFSVVDPPQPSGTGDTTTTTGLDSKLDMAVVHWMCEYVMIARRELAYAQYFNQKWKEALSNYASNQISRQSREGDAFLDNNRPYLSETF